MNCQYRDTRCLGETEIISQDKITQNDISNIVRVDQGCYNARDLNRWLNNNPSLPHNRRLFTTTDLNQCIYRNNSPRNYGTSGSSGSSRYDLDKRLGVMRRNVDALVRQGKPRSFFSDTMLRKLATLCATNHQVVCFETIRQYVDQRYQTLSPADQISLSDLLNQKNYINMGYDSAWDDYHDNNSFYRTLKKIKKEIDIYFTLGKKLDYFDQDVLSELTEMCDYSKRNVCYRYIVNYLTELYSSQYDTMRDIIRYKKKKNSRKKTRKKSKKNRKKTTSKKSSRKKKKKSRRK